ncbi:beta-ketoacyl synthase chain length factor [Chitinophagaceae bacterium 26-R-25]|nr:beta-ketoacyl synthase chain length factor [Chitinophagaceae bacterium 26-R-25]
MFNPVYITSARAICAQDTFSNNNLPEETKAFEQNILNYHEPDYKKYFTIMQLRRMTRIIKIGLVTAIEALKDAKLEQPQAIITGTAKGSMTDTEKFLHDIVDFNEGTLNPTAFIQSTYNALNGLIALHHNANGYNSTYVHRGFSLENALMDAIMLFEENRIENALIGCFEEMTAEHYELKKKMGYWKNESMKNIDLLNSPTTGTIAGEGTFFFTLNKSAENAIAKLNGLRMLYNVDEALIKTTFKSFLAEHNLTLDEVDTVFLSYNGNSQTRHFEDAISQQLSPSTNQLAFKHLCGEFDTAAGFALWAGAKILQHQTIHPSLILKKGTSSSLKNVVIYNQYNGKEHAFYLLEKI